MCDDIDLDYYQKCLEDRLAAITAGQETRAQDATSAELDQTRIGRLSRMDAMQQRAMSEAAARLEDLERQRIRTALGRIKAGEYGFCVVCEDEIAEGRLQFDPSVPTCISCAQRAEEK